MLIRLFLSALFVGLCSFCLHSTTPASTGSNQDDSLMEHNLENTVIRAIRYESGKPKGVTVSKENTESIISIVRNLLETSEPMRIHLEMEEIQSLRSAATGFEIFFSPALETSSDAARLSKMFFLTEGDFSTRIESTNARFFVALDDNNQYIQSPFEAESKAELVGQLNDLLK